MIILSTQFSKPIEDILLNIKYFKTYGLLGFIFIYLFIFGEA